jgi:hypothetical protein
MPPADSTTGLACCPRSFSALGDQRAEILPVQRPPTLAVGARCMMRLTRILIFPFFLSASWISCPKSRCLPKCPDANERYFLRDRPFFVRIAVIVVQTGATSAGPYAQRSDRSPNCSTVTAMESSRAPDLPFWRGRPLPSRCLPFSVLYSTLPPAERRPCARP